MGWWSRGCVRSTVTRFVVLGAAGQLIILVMLLLGEGPRIPLSRSSVGGRGIALHGGVGAADADTDDEQQHIAGLGRHRCIQDALHAEMGSVQHRKLRWHTGCRYAPLKLGFAEWARTRTACLPQSPRAPLAQVRVHVTVHQATRDWQRCIAAFARSWHESQPIGATTLVVWVLGDDRAQTGTGDHTNRAAEALVATVERIVGAYTDKYHTVIVRDVTSVPRLRNATAAAGCVTAAMWEASTEGAEGKRLQTRADLLRIAALYTEGGVWFDVCAVLLTPLPAVLQYANEFGVLRAMSPSYSPVALALRRRSPTARALLGLVCKYPKSDERAVWGPYCTDAGQPCPLSAWYSHPPLSWAFRHRLGMVMLPAALFDPIGDCPCAGGPHTTGAGTLLPISAAGVPVDPTERIVDAFHNAHMAAAHRQLKTPAKCSAPDPSFIPAGPCTRYSIRPFAAPNVCLSYDGSRAGPVMRGVLSLRAECSRAAIDRDEKVVWLHCPANEVAVLRNSADAIDAIACVDGRPGGPVFAPCVAGRQAQGWTLERLADGADRIQAVDGKCLATTPHDRTKECVHGICLDVQLKPCADHDSAQQWTVTTVGYHGEARLLVDTNGSASALIGGEVY